VSAPATLPRRRDKAGLSQAGEPGLLLARKSFRVLSGLLGRKSFRELWRAWGDLAAAAERAWIALAGREGPVAGRDPGSPTPGFPRGVNRARRRFQAGGGAESPLACGCWGSSRTAPPIACAPRCKVWRKCGNRCGRRPVLRPRFRAWSSFARFLTRSRPRPSCPARRDSSALFVLAGWFPEEHGTAHPLGPLLTGQARPAAPLEARRPTARSGAWLFLFTEIAAARRERWALVVRNRVRSFSP
jgi:hypothetical protein